MSTTVALCVLRPVLYLCNTTRPERCDGTAETDWYTGCNMGTEIILCEVSPLGMSRNPAWFVIAFIVVWGGSEETKVMGKRARVSTV